MLSSLARCGASYLEEHDHDLTSSRTVLPQASETLIGVEPSLLERHLLEHTLLVVVLGGMMVVVVRCVRVRVALVRRVPPTLRHAAGDQPRQRCLATVETRRQSNEARHCVGRGLGGSE